VEEKRQLKVQHRQNCSQRQYTRQPGLSILFAVTSTLVHLKRKHLPIPHWSDHILNMHLSHGTHSQPETLPNSPNLIKSNADLQASPKTTINGPSQSHNSPLNSVGIDQRRNARLTLFYKSIHGANSIPVHHLRQPTRHTRQCGTHTFTSLSSRTNVYTNTRTFPELLSTGMLYPDSARSAPSTDTFRAALHRLSTSPSNSHC